MFYFASLKSQFSYTLNVKTDCFIWPFSDTGDTHVAVLMMLSHKVIL